MGFPLRKTMKEEKSDELDYKTLLTNEEKLEATGFMTETKKDGFMSTKCPGTPHI